ncbi:recombinase family protein [Azospirillum melinis]|uniref:Recombinase family protein n=1 Tax=Azospirillum melinis TaxID=328839 RepID=A0ABX2KFZ9_9PROT|nr:recombinase family protein [Azospirillum melinis]MBP2306281.1 DNA invertase Pin-like site-specific DNA recombinase [Azospirillum melinis]NUB00224.1 recombinase family protein [Azospirillum melinis]
MTLIGYARVSTDDQTTAAQLDALHAAGCAAIFEEKASGASRARPELARTLARLARGDTLVIWKLDRLGRSLSHLLEVIEDLRSRGCHFRCLTSPIDTASPHGTLVLQMLGAVAEYERSLISERTRAGLKAAKARGRVGGNPKLKQGDTATARRLAERQRQLYLMELTRTAEEWLPTVRRLRPVRSWAAVTRAVNAKLPLGRHWTAERLRRAVRAFVEEGLAERALLDKTTSVRGDDRLMVLVAGIARANPTLSLRAIGAQLEAMRETTPRGGRSWAAASVKNLLDRARAQGLLSNAPVIASKSAS